MTRLVFESATLVDAVKQIERVAPSRGQAFDKASGIVIDITPDQPVPVVLRATNLDIYMMSWVDTLACEGTQVSWRVPSKVFAQFICSLPIASGKEVIIEDGISDGGYTQLHVSCGKGKARFNLLQTEYYPAWGAFDPASCGVSLDLGGRIAQVEWAAASNGEPPYAGVYFDGERVYATDRYRLATVPLPVSLDEPITVPSGVLGQILKQTGECSVAVNGGQLLIMPDDYTQIRAILYGVEYPRVANICKRTFDTQITLRKTPLIEIMHRVEAFAGADRSPAIRLFFGKEEIGVLMNNDEIGRALDVIEVPGFADHPRFEVKFTPKNILQPLEMAPNEEVTLNYNQGDPKSMVMVDGGSGYQAFSMPRVIGDE